MIPKTFISPSEAQIQIKGFYKKKKNSFRLDRGPFLILYLYGIHTLSIIIINSLWEKLLWIQLYFGSVILSHILLMLFAVWSVRIKALVQYSRTQNLNDATFVLVQLTDYTQAKELVSLNKKKSNNSKDTIELSFEVRKQRYIYNEENRKFEKLRYPIHEKLSWYMEWKGYKTVEEAADALSRWGANLFEVPIPEFLKLLEQQLLAPFFIFQVACVALWFMDEYWIYSLFTLIMLVCFEATVAMQRQRNLRHFKSLQKPKQAILVYRCHKWEKTPGEYLMPGDIISITQSTSDENDDAIPADALLLSGTCIADESVLTGESTPQWKSPITDIIENGSDLNTCLDIRKDKLHVIFGGTKVLQHTKPEKYNKLNPPDHGCPAIVLRTGFETAQGNLMRTILYSTENVNANNLETGLFILFLLVFALIAAAYVLMEGLSDPERSRFKLFLTCSMIITSVIPPELPLELTIAVNNSLVELAKRRVYCTEPFRIPFAGKVDICCFDKTGTLTDDSLVFQGIATDALIKSELKKEDEKIPLTTQRVLAACHSLISISNQIVGDPLEKASFQAIKWKITENNQYRNPNGIELIVIKHRFHFSSQLKRMSTIIRVHKKNSNNIELYVVSKGAPEVLEHRFKEKPLDYSATYKKYAAKGCRILALGYKSLNPETDNEILLHNNREEAESNLIFAGFVVFQCPLKPESEATLKMLKDSSHELMMITGDTPLTACHAAAKVHIVTRDVLILTLKSLASNTNLSELSEEAFEWISPDETNIIPFENDKSKILELASIYDFCVTGESFHYLKQINLLEFVIPLVQVFARVAPEHKEIVVYTLRTSGRTTLMCGDGTNDVGGLKAAHVGVALLTEANKTQNHQNKLQKIKNAMKHDKHKKSQKNNSKNNPAQRLIEELEKKGEPVNPSMKKIAQLIEDLDTESTLVKPGDACLAAPFTSKIASVLPCTRIIKQGRSTLVSTVQMFKICGLMSLCSAYALSVMYLQGVKIGDIQATIIGTLTTAMYFFLSSSKPQEYLSEVRPHPNIFCPYVMLSLLVQFGVHMFYLIYMYNCAVPLLPVTEEMKYDTTFKPNIVNTVCYLVQFIIQIITFTVNYAGAPFVVELKNNKGLYKSIMASVVLTIFILLDAFPGLLTVLEMVSIPPFIRLKIAILGLIDFLITYGVEKSLRVLFPAKVPLEKGYLLHIKDKKNQ